MYKKSKIRFAVAAAFIAASAAGNTAFAVDEMELNDLVSMAQQLDVSSGVAEVQGSVGVTLTGDSAVYDVDFYAFKGREGDVVTIDIDDGAKVGTTTLRSVDTVTALYGPDLRKIGDGDKTAMPFDEGTVGIADAYIDKVRLNKGDGTYYVGVTSWASGRQFRDGGIVTTTTPRAPGTNGSYTLIISGLKPNMQVINIDIRPGATEPAPYNPKSKGGIPVALLSSAEFDALKVDPASLTFGATGTENSWQRCGKDGTDVDDDGRLDLVCHFDSQAAKFDIDHTLGKLMGKTDAGQPFYGTGLLKIVPMRKE